MDTQNVAYSYKEILFSNLKKQKELLASHEEILVTLKYILLRNSVWKVYILLTLWKLSDILEKWTIEMRGWKNCTWSTGKQESETIMYKTIIVGTWHYVFFKPHITVKNKEWILTYTKKNLMEVGESQDERQNVIKESIRITNILHDLTEEDSI